MLIDDFYTCKDIREQPNGFSCRILFNAAHDIFKGHFPGNPVVPGVCTIEIIKELLQKQVNRPLMLSSTGNVKFLQLVTPEVEPVIDIAWKEAEDGQGYAVKASLKNDAVFLFKFDGNYV